MTDAISEVVEAYKKLAYELIKDPDNPEHISNQLNLLMARGNRTAAHLALARRAERLAPNEFIAVFNLGSAQLRAGHYWESLETFKRALPMAPPEYRVETLNHIGLGYHDLGQFQRAIDEFNAIIAQGIANRATYQNRALSTLGLGDLRGLFDFECVYNDGPRKPIAHSGVPRWRGESLDGKHIIVHHEQGYGDFFQFLRFLPKIHAGKVTVAAPPELLDLARDNFIADDWVGEDGPFDADYYCSLMSAVGASGWTYAQVTGEPYMMALPRKMPERSRMKVGLAWRGSSSYVQDTNRSMELDDLCPLFELPYKGFYSLQVGSGSKDITKLGLDGFVADLGPSLANWRDTARAIAAMDVIVSVDTAVAHLAGALGKPVMLLLPFACCWRWMRGRDDTPWYRNTKLFRQTVPLDWKEPIGRVRDALEEFKV